MPAWHPWAFPYMLCQLRSQLDLATELAATFSLRAYLFTLFSFRCNETWLVHKRLIRVHIFLRVHLPKGTVIESFLLLSA
jgi:hypothetical protein